jgi:hypothetical protein
MQPISSLLCSQEPRGQTPSWEANSHSAYQFPALYGTQKFVIMFTTAHCWSLCWGAHCWSLCWGRWMTYFPKIHSNIIIPSTLRSSTCLFPLGFLNWAPCSEGVLEEWRYSTTLSLTPALDGGEWSALRPGHYPQRKSSWYPLDRRLGEPQSRSGWGNEEKNFQPRRKSNPRIPNVQPMA